ncbi:hypothetical protein [Streptomyces sp. NPDC093598]|uniref:hypothetical protein n=1 Tax=Streptomyces sp. NPDC093598 TaxID=3366046 RepID=UPI0038119BB8
MSTAGRAAAADGDGELERSRAEVRDLRARARVRGPDRTFRQAHRSGSGSRGAVLSVPLTTASGLCVGMVSAHMDRPLHGLTAAQTKALDTVGGQAGRWLAWHDRTVVLDALEHLHALGRAGRGARFRRF